MLRLALGLEYNGANYQGWQRQNSIPTIQATLEKALSSVADMPLLAVCAGRTDAKVHAAEQVVHFDIPLTLKRPLQAWVMGTNANLPHDIRVRWCVSAPDAFDARKTAVSRRYRYFILNQRIRPGILTHNTTWIYRKLDVAAMHMAAQILLGTHDFTSFRDTQCEAKTPVRTLRDIRVYYANEAAGLICLDVTANAFLHHMVRNIVGVLVKIGCLDRPIEWIADVLAAKDRTKAAMTAPAEGLYLVKVEYPDNYELPNKNTIIGPWFAAL